jgi:hypothetical protein
MPKPKHTIEVLPSKEDLALDRLANAVLQRIADKEAAEPETDEELSESVLMHPWCLPRDISQAIRRLIPVWHSEKHALVYEEHGCFKCERKDVPHQSLGLCLRCYGLYIHRLQAAIVKKAGETAGRPSVGKLKAALTLKSDSARNILAEIVAGGTGIVAKPTKRLGRPSLGNGRGTGR